MFFLDKMKELELTLIIMMSNILKDYNWIKMLLQIEVFYNSK